MAREWNPKYDGFKLDASKIGGYIVEAWHLREPLFMFGVKIGSSVMSGSPKAYGIFRVDWYNKKSFPENNYKAKLVPVGKLKDFMPDRAWYCSDIESSLHFGVAEYFEDPFEALEYANKKNAELFPNDAEFFGQPKKLNCIQKFIKNLFKI